METIFLPSQVLICADRSGSPSVLKVILPEAPCEFFCTCQYFPDIVPARVITGVIDCVDRNEISIVSKCHRIFRFFVFAVFLMICLQELLGFLVDRIICCKEVYKCEVLLADTAAELRAEFLLLDQSVGPRNMTSNPISAA